MAVNKYPWSRNIYGAQSPLRFMGLVQAGSTATIKAGEICVYNETSGYWVPANAVADARYSLAISAEEQKSTDLLRYMEFFGIREGDVWEFAAAAARGFLLGDALTLTASDSQTLTYDADGQAVAFVVSSAHYPQTGSTVRSVSYIEVMFNPEFSFLYKNVFFNRLKKLINTTASITLLPEDCGAIVTNVGASGGITVTLPNATVPIGWHVCVACSAADAIQVDPKPDTASVIIKGGAQTAGKYVSITDEGDFMDLVWNGTNWLGFRSISGADGDISVQS